MSFYEIYQQYKDLDFDNFWKEVTEYDILSLINKAPLSPEDYLKLLSPAAERHLEQMAQKSHALTIQHFGKTILLYTPLYLSNYCINQCLYCGFNVQNELIRKHLSLEELEEEAHTIAQSGLKHILLLTGEAPNISNIDYLTKCINIVKKYFPSITIEVYPLSTGEYYSLIAEGVDGLTIYQETYDERNYAKLHISGPKKDYIYRLDTAERAAQANIRSINIGALLGLSEWQKDAFFTGLHAMYLQNKYPDIEISISLPRIRPQLGDFQAIYPVNDKNLVQFICAFRLFMPRAGITLSTRETEYLRNNLLPLGITKMSAASSTIVGGHSQKNKGGEQFTIADQRNVGEISKDISKAGYQTVFKDWHPLNY